MKREHSSGLVAIVDDDRSVQSALKDLLESAEEFLASERRSETACLVTDVSMPGLSGLELQAQLKAEGSLIPIIFITAHSDAKMKAQALEAGAVGFLSKPFDDEVLLEHVQAAING